MIRLSQIVILTFALLSCKSSLSDREVPKDLIPRDKMVEVIKELVKLESYVKVKYPAVTQFHKAIINSGDSLFNAHGITFDEFDSSMDYYGVDQVEMKSIYSDALNQLNHELGELQTKK